MVCLCNHTSSPEQIQRNPPEERGWGGLYFGGSGKENRSPFKGRAAEGLKRRCESNETGVSQSCFFVPFLP